MSKNIFNETPFEQQILSLLYKKSLEIPINSRNKIVSREIKIGETLDKNNDNYAKNEKKWGCSTIKPLLTKN